MGSPEVEWRGAKRLGTERKDSPIVGACRRGIPVATRSGGGGENDSSAFYGGVQGRNCAGSGRVYATGPNWGATAPRGAVVPRGGLSRSAG